MRPAHRAPTALLLLLPLVLPGCLTDGDGEADERLEGEVELPAGGNGFLELNLLVDEGASIAFSWSAGGDLQFDVHRHVGGTVEFLEQTAGRDGAGAVTAPADGALSFLWENRGPAAVTVTYHLRGDFAVDSIHAPHGHAHEH